MGSWDDTSLAAETAKLEGTGYMCFLEHQRGLIALSGGCWAPEFEIRKWSDVICVHRTYSRILDALYARSNVS